VEVFYDVEAAAVDVEVDVPPLEAWGAGLPDPDLWVPLLDEEPRPVADALAVLMRGDEQHLEVAAVPFDGYDGAADGFSVEEDPVGVAVVDAFLYGRAGDDLAVLLVVLVAEAELDGCAVLEGLLVVLYELLAVGGVQGGEGDGHAGGDGVGGFMRFGGTVPLVSISS